MRREKCICTRSLLGNYSQKWDRRDDVEFTVYLPEGKNSRLLATTSSTAKADNGFIVSGRAGAAKFSQIDDLRTQATMLVGAAYCKKNYITDSDLW